ncbi:hypothetical protein AKJ09_02675 [Labilithrix luteola]|uniref:Uncharacterized protein n=1 Tax=Labilithrix luteola TaxID=1391654 RepID=A0A0K1PRK7_9BACT|nr:DUF1574 family protein [Labilithrix luteola]AKU96011.1 hypothetical protein AKJ09_02675 [Labilithrix luteola]
MTRENETNATNEASEARDAKSSEPAASADPATAGAHDQHDQHEEEGSMKSFLVAFSVMVGTLLCAELMFRESQLLKKIPKGYHLSAKQEEYRKVGGDIVVTGDSRMFHGVVPSAMTETLKQKTGKTYQLYNMGIPSGTTPIFLIAAHEAARHKPPPKAFVIGVTPALFSCCDTVASLHVSAGVNPENSVLLAQGTILPNTEEAGNSIAYGASRLLQFRTDVVNALKDGTIPPPLSFQDHGWITMGPRLSATTQDTRARGRAVGYADLMDKSKGSAIRKPSVNFVREAVQVLQRAGVKVAIIGTPQSRQLDWYHDHAHVYYEYIDAVQAIANETNVPFVDLNSFPGLENIDFVDGDHLSEPGAVKFTNYLSATVLAPLLEGN